MASRGSLIDLLRSGRGGADEDPAAFWQETAARRGGEVTFFTFATFLGGTPRGADSLPGLLYVVNDIFWFEDFERDNWLSRIITSRSKYEKTELTFPKADVVLSRMVSRVGAARCISGALPAEKLTPASALTRFFSTPVAQVAMRDGSSLFFDVMQWKGFLALFSGKTAL